MTEIMYTIKVYRQQKALASLCANKVIKHIYVVIGDATFLSVFMFVLLHSL